MITTLWRRLAALGAVRSGRGPLVTVRYEQAVYGSFAFRPDGYALLAQSPGCRPEWLSAFRAACQKVGERPAGALDVSGLLTVRPSDGGGVWIVVGMSPQGCDDLGRPGALGFHALFLTPREFRKIRYDPFVLARALTSTWSADVTSLPSAAWSTRGRDEPGPACLEPRAVAVAEAIAAGRRVLLESTGPIEGLARQVWTALPVRVRARVTVATWTYSNALRFDLAAVPRLAGIALDPSYLDPATINAWPEALAGEATAASDPREDRGTAPPPASSTPAASLLRWVLGVLIVGLAGTGVALAVRGVGRDDEEPLPVVVAPPPPTRGAIAPPPIAPRDADAPPSRADYAETPADLDRGEQQRVAEVLVDLMDRCGLSLAEPAGDGPDPAALMVRLSERLRYREPFLNEAERAALAGSRGQDRDAALALQWDTLMRRFAGDRPLTDARLRGGSLRWRLAMLAWSFHLTDASRPPSEGPRRSPSEDAQAFAEAFAIDVPLRDTPVVARYPALAGYLTFLGRLPRR